ncbi:MAG: glycoside hydrolase family 172 protein [Bacteroidales bacterium]
MISLLRFFIILSLIMLHSATISGKDRVTLGNLFDEMVNLERLVNIPAHQYRSIQFSSYDRRSTSPYEEWWFANSDGFGREPVPNFEKVLKEPDESGIGEYLICDVRQPGVILRLWTAGINGEVKVFLDDMESPFFNGRAEDFFWKIPELLMGRDLPYGIFRQFDAVYFPVPFSERLRIEWIGNLTEVHFYHVGLRVYDKGIHVERFTRDALDRYSQKIDQVIGILKNIEPVDENDIQNDETVVRGYESEVLWESGGMGAIDHFSIQAIASDQESVLRKSILSIYFDNSSTPQVQSPLGDFFGAAPGVNPFRSHPFSVDENGEMVSLFIMPYRQNVRIEVTNQSEEDVRLLTGIKVRDYQWEEGSTMHFRARWRINHDVTASDTEICDFPYLMALGQGRIVGAATYIYNPSNVPTSWGNWWGEGDEKIFIDDDLFPSFFGTGSEDYYNYSWSSARIFSYPYCGQPRNDGPGNRGYVANFRWHILDDIPFNRNIAFYMELLHHGVVPRTSYGRIVYYYALPATIDDFQQITVDDTRDLPYYSWTPEPFKGSAGNRFVMAEDIVEDINQITMERGKLWSGGRILMWEPQKIGDRIRFIIESNEEMNETRLGFTMAKMPSGGTISLSVNGKPVKIGGSEDVSLYEDYQTILDNFTTEQIQLIKGRNEVVFESRDKEPGKKIGFDFIWLRE